MASARSLIRYSRRTRWFHTAVYALTGIVAFTGIWLLLGQEGDASPLAQLVSTADVEIHENVGWVLTGLAGLALIFGRRGVRTFITKSFTFSRSDAVWVRRWPAAVFTGRFGPHDGHFDPGQRVANIIMAGGLLILIVSGIGLVRVSGGEAFVWLLRIHRWTTYVVVPVIAGHVVLALGVLPGYRGVWRAMHWGGAIHAEVAQRLWPTWARDELIDREATSLPPIPRKD